MILQNTLVGHADDFSLLVEVPEPSNRVPAVLPSYRDLALIGDWCKHWGMLVNPNK